MSAAPATHAMVDQIVLGATPVGQCLERVARGAQFGRQTEGVTFRVPIQAKAE